MSDVFDAETGELIPPNLVATAIQEGRASIDPNSEFILRDNAGKRIRLAGNDAADQLAQKLSLGYTIETPEITQQIADVQDAQASPIQGGVEALAQGATLGLYGAAAGQIAPQYAQGLVARRDALGGVATGLEIAGAVLPSFVSGGTLTPAGLLARGTERAGLALERSLISKGVGEGVAKVAGMGAEGLLDGAVTGATQQLSEDSLGGHEITAERLAAAGGVGALLGLGGGTALGTAANVVRKGARGIADKIAARKAGAEVAEEAAEALGAKDAGFFKIVPDAVKEPYIKASAAATGVDEDFIREAWESPGLRADWLDQDKIREAHNKNLREAIQGTVDFDPAVRSMAAGELKADTVRRDIIHGRPAAELAQLRAQPIFLDIEQTLARLEPDLSPAEFKKYRRDLNDVEVRLQQAVQEGNNTDLYITLENYKRAFDANVDRGPRANSGSQLERRNFEEVFELSRRSGDKLRKLLEDEEVFGELGRKQRERNAALRQVIDSGVGFNDALMRKTGESANPEQWWLDRRVADGDKTHTFLNDLNNPLRDQKVEIVQRHFEALDNLYDTLLRNGEIPESKMEEFTRAQAGAKKSLEILKNASTQLQKIGAMNALEKAGREATGALSPASLGVVGGFVGGGVGATIGAGLGGALNIVSRPGGLFRQAAQLEAIQRRALGVSQSVRTKTQSAVRSLATPKARRVGKAGIRASVLLFGADRDSQRKNARKIETRLSELRKEPQRFVDALAYQTRGVADSAPKTAMAVTAQTQRALTFLESKLPAPPSNPNRMQPSLNKLQWTDEQIDKFARYAATIKDPLSALDDLKSGKLSPESVEALQAVYPTLYAEMRQAAMEEIATKGDELPYDSVIQLSLLLGFAGHPTLEPQFVKTIQDTWKNPPKEEAVGPSPSNVKPLKIRQTEVDRLMGGLQA